MADPSASNEARNRVSEPDEVPLMYDSKWVIEGRRDVSDVQRELVEEFNKKYGLD